MKTKQALVPQLRFGEFNNRWEHSKLGDSASLTSSKRVYLTDYVDTGIPFYRGKEITELRQGIKPKDVLYISDEAYNNFKEKYGVPEVGDILITAVGTLGNIYRVPNDDPFYFKDGNLIWMRRVKPNSMFLEIYLSYKKRDIDKSSIGSTQRALTIVELKKIKLSLPSLPEQEKIAAFLTSVDDRIDQLKRKKSLLQDYKKGVMQKLFSQELRFKDDNGKPYPDWEEKKLGGLGATYGGLSGKSGDDFGEGMPFVTYSQIFGSSVIDMEKCKLVRIEEGESQNQIKKGDILFTTSSETRLEVGFTSVVLEEPNEVYLNSFCFGFRLNGFDALLTEFARYLFHSSEIRRSIAVLGQGSTRYNISKKELMKLELLLPTVPEQTKIANFLSTLDQKIEQIDTQIIQTQTFKKGLLQQMFV